MTPTEAELIEDLAPREAWLLQVLDAHRNRVVARQTLLDIVWGPGYAGDPGTLAVHMTRLRTKLRTSRSALNIRTVRGLGYILEDATPQP